MPGPSVCPGCLRAANHPPCLVAVCSLRELLFLHPFGIYELGLEFFGRPPSGRTSPGTIADGPRGQGQRSFSYRGLTVDGWIVADEAARLPEDLIAALRPMRARRGTARPRGPDHANHAPAVLGPEPSAELRDRLLGELNDLANTVEAAFWAQRSLPEKNKLVVGDAQRLDEEFRAKLTSLTTPDSANPQPLTGRSRRLAGSSPLVKPKKRSRAKAIDKAMLLLSEPRRICDREHVKYVATKSCLICGRSPTDSHHLRCAQSRALGRKVSDEFTVPLCRGHHRDVHHCGDEAAWWQKAGIDPSSFARALWLETHPLPAASRIMGVEGATVADGVGPD
jgi:hypothetical protein